MDETPCAKEETSVETGYATREKLNIPRCQYGVPCESAYMDGYVADCGEPAIAKWSWPDGSTMFVCEVHDLTIEQAEE